MEKDPEKLDLMHARIGMGTHTILGIIVGWASIPIAAMLGNWLTVLIGIVILIIFGYGMERLLGKKGIKWWFGNGIIIYLLIWLVSWTFFFNLVG